MLLCFLGAQSQTLRNHYASIAWLEDNLISDSLSLNGLSLVKSPVDVLDAPLSLMERDSNSKSRIVYRNGSNLNQHFFASLSRPITESISFFFDLKRYSYAGWMDRSYYRSTQIQSGLSIRSVRKLNLLVAVSYANQDRELNGGLQSSNYQEGETVGGAFQSVYTDIHLSSAYQRTAHLNARVDGEYEVWKNSRSGLYMMTGIGISQEQYAYEDESEFELAFYDRYGVDLAMAVSDSTRITTLNEQAGARLFVGDSLNRFEVGCYYHQFQHEVLNNGRSFSAWNNSISGFAHGNFRSLFMRADAVQYLLGFNAGDLRHSLGTGFHGVIPRDSGNVREWEISMRFVRTAAYPTLQYFNYRSDVLNSQFAKRQSQETRVELHASWETPHWKLSLTPGRSTIDNFQYWDSSATLTLLPSTLEFQYLKASVQFRTDHVEASVLQWLQESSNEDAYALPRFASQGELFTLWPVFKQRLFTKVGFTAQYFSRYQARGYIPYLAVYYSQSEQTFGEYLQLNFHAEITIKNTSVYFGVQNLNHELFLSPVLVGPNYPSVPRYLIFGIDWKFKN